MQSLWEPFGDFLQRLFQTKLRAFRDIRFDLINP